MIQTLLKYYLNSDKFKYFFIYLSLCIFIYPLENIGLSKLNSKLYPLLGKNEANPILILIIILFIVVYSIKILKDFIKLNVNPYINSSIRIRYFELILKKYKKNFEYTHSGELLNQLLMFPETIKILLNKFTNTIVPETFGFIITLIYILKQDSNLGLVILANIIIFVITLYVLLPKGRKIYLEQINSRNNLIDKFSQEINNSFQIYITNSIPKSIRTIFEANKRLKKAVLDLGMYDATIFTIAKVLYLLSLIYIINYLSRKFILKDIGYDGVVLRLSLSISALKNIMSVENASNLILKDYLVIDNKLGEIINKNIDGDVKVDIKSIAINNIAFKYPKTSKNILENLSFNIGLGDKLVLFGKSGSGKSTILKLLLGFFTPSSGKILINNYLLDNMDLTYYRNQFAYVSQNTKLFNMTVMDNIKYNINTTDNDILALINKYNITIYDNLEKGLETNAGIDGNNLSGGQKQMVHIIRAILKDAKIYLFDEPTSALDPKTREIIYNILQSLDKTMIIISHDPKIKKFIPTVYNLENRTLVKS